MFEHSVGIFSGSTFHTLCRTLLAAAGAQLPHLGCHLHRILFLTNSYLCTRAARIAYPYLSDLLAIGCQPIKPEMGNCVDSRPRCQWPSRSVLLVTRAGLRLGAQTETETAGCDSDCDSCNARHEGRRAIESD